MTAEYLTAARARSHGGRPCGVRLILEAMDETEAGDLRDALALSTAEVPTPAIADVLDGKGHTIGAGALNNHRRGDCRCPR